MNKMDKDLLLDLGVEVLDTCLIVARIAVAVTIVGAIALKAIDKKL